MTHQVVNKNHEFENSMRYPSRCIIW